MRTEAIVEYRQDADGVRLRSMAPGDIGWIISQHGELYAREYGWDQSFEALVARLLAERMARFDPDMERVWIAERAGERIGCVLVVRKSPRTAQLRMLIVRPEARGLGLGARLVDECLAFARARSYRRMVLWTHDCLTRARGIYRARGFRMRTCRALCGLRLQTDERNLGTEPLISRTAMRQAPDNPAHERAPAAV